MGKFKDLIGQRFGRITVIGRYDNDSRKKARFLCHCNCGNEIIVSSSALISGHTASCGCLHKQMLISHGMTDSPEYQAWNDILQRCNNPQNDRFKDYGARGIKVFYLSFKDFFADVETRPTSKHTIDRINNDGNYEPGNCRWATQKEQGNNRRTNLLIEFNGQKKTLSQWAETIGINYNTLRQRILYSKWSVEKSLTKRLQQGIKP